jgi:cytoskeletal protein RodZ
MEKGQLEALPGQAYITGFIRVYARHLGLDSDELLGRLNALQEGARLNCQIPILLTKP